MSNATNRAVIAMTLRSAPNDILAALNNTVQLTCIVGKENIGYDWALNSGLIKESGYATFDDDDTQVAFAYEVLRRVQDGEWN